MSKKSVSFFECQDCILRIQDGHVVLFVPVFVVGALYNDEEL